MAGVVERSRVRRSLLVGVHGVSTWFVAVMLSAYLSDGHGNWTTVDGVATSATTATATWLSAPTSTALGLLGLLGIALAVFGPPIYVLWPRVPERIPDDGIRRLSGGFDGIRRLSGGFDGIRRLPDRSGDQHDAVIETDPANEFEWVQDPEPAAVRTERSARRTGASTETPEQRQGAGRQQD